MMNFVRLSLVLIWIGISAILPARAQTGLREVPLGFCSLSSMSSSTGLSSCAMATFTGTGSGKNLTVSSVTGIIGVGEVLSGTGIPSGTIVASQSTGTPGGAGVYVTSVATTSNGASLTASGPPTAATYAAICAYAQAVVWRDDGVAPTATPGSGGQGIAAGSCIPYNGTLSAFRAIQQTGGAILGVSFYK